MFCKKCGRELADQETVCPACATEQGTSVQNKQMKEPASGATKGLGIASMVCSILGAYGHLFGLVPVIPMVIAAIVTGVLSNNKAKEQGQEKSGFATAGLITGSVVAGLHVLSLIVAFLTIGLILVIYVLYFAFIIGMLGVSAETGYL